MQEREEDIYEVFEEAIDSSIQERVNAVILAGDIFHTPRPNGSSIIRLAKELKKLKEKDIPAFFILGEHDINRMQDVPVPYVFHNLKLATGLTENNPVRVGNVTIFGFNKERRSNVDSMIEKFKVTERMAIQEKRNNPGSKNVLVLHQGLIDFNRFAGELNSTDLPNGFDYYAMGHYHDRIEKKFDYLQGIIAYPGSIDLGPSEGIKDIDKGFYIVDFSANEIETKWLKLEKRRPQFSFDIEYDNINEGINSISSTVRLCTKKPVIMIKINGKTINSKLLASQIERLGKDCLHYVWKIAESDINSSLVLDNKPIDMEQELYKLSKQALASERKAQFAMNELLPLLGRGDWQAALELVWKNYSEKKPNDLLE